MKNGIAANRSPSIVTITTVVILMMLGFLVVPWLIPQYPAIIRFSPAVFLGLVLLVCYLRSPTEYEITSDGKLIIRSRAGSRVFGPVKTCLAVQERVSFGVRLWGNGGLFSATGIYWNKSYGRFRAYVTNVKSLVLVELQDGKKVLISPANAEEWVCRA